MKNLFIHSQTNPICSVRFHILISTFYSTELHAQQCKSWKTALSFSGTIRHAFMATVGKVIIDWRLVFWHLPDHSFAYHF